MGIGYHHMHQAMRRHGVFPSVGLVNAGRAAVVFETQIVRPLNIAQMRPVQRGAGGDFAVRFGMRRNGFWIRRLKAKPAGHLNRAQDDLQQMQAAAGLKAIGMGRYATHGVKGHRAANHLIMLIAAEIGPGLVKLEGLIKGNAGQICSDGPDPICGNPAALRHVFRRIVIRQITLGQMLEHRAMPFIGGGQIWRDALGVKGHRLSAFAVNNQQLAICAAQQHAFVRPLGAVHQCRRIGQLSKVIQIHFASFKQQMHHG